MSDWSFKLLQCSQYRPCSNADSFMLILITTLKASTVQASGSKLRQMKIPSLDEILWLCTWHGVQDWMLFQWVEFWSLLVYKKLGVHFTQTWHLELSKVNMAESASWLFCFEIENLVHLQSWLQLLLWLMRSYLNGMSSIPAVVIQFLILCHNPQLPTFINIIVLQSKETSSLIWLTLLKTNILWFSPQKVFSEKCYFMYMFQFKAPEAPMAQSLKDNINHKSHFSCDWCVLSVVVILHLF